MLINIILRQFYGSFGVVLCEALCTCYELPRQAADEGQLLCFALKLSSGRFTSACWKTSIQQSPLPAAAIELKFGVEIFPLAFCCNDIVAVGAHFHILREAIGRCRWQQKGTQGLRRPWDEGGTRQDSRNERTKVKVLAGVWECRIWGRRKGG